MPDTTDEPIVHAARDTSKPLDPATVAAKGADGEAARAAEIARREAEAFKEEDGPSEAAEVAAADDAPEESGPVLKATKIAAPGAETAPEKAADAKEPKEPPASATDIARATFWLNAFKVPAKVRDALTPEEQIAYAADLAKMQKGIDKRVDHAKTTAGLDALDDSEEDDEGEDGDEPKALTDPEELSPEDQKLLDEVLDPDAAAKLRSRLIAANKSEAKAIAKQVEERTARVAERVQTMKERVEAARAALSAETYPELKDEAEFQKVLHRMSVNRPWDPSKKNAPSASEFEKLMRQCANYEFADKRVAAAREVQKQHALAITKGQLSRTTVSSTPGKALMSHEDAMFSAMEKFDEVSAQKQHYEQLSGKKWPLRS
jgi:hypothetical protein